MANKKNVETGEKKRKKIVKQVIFFDDEWDIIEREMKKEKIIAASQFMRRAVMLYIGKYHQTSCL